MMVSLEFIRIDFRTDDDISKGKKQEKTDVYLGKRNFGQSHLPRNSFKTNINQCFTYSIAEVHEERLLKKHI